MADDTLYETVPDSPQPTSSMWWNHKKNPTDPQSIEGEVLEVRTGDKGLYVVLMTADGKKATPSHTNLVDKLHTIKVGQYLLITHTGQRSVGKGNMETYTVQIRKGYQSQITQQPPAPAPAAVPSPAHANPQAQNGLSVDILVGTAVTELVRLSSPSIYNGKIPEAQCIGACQRTVLILNVPYNAGDLWKLIKDKGRVGLAQTDASGDYYKVV